MALEKKTRREFLEVIDQQKEQLGRYEARLKDVVRAYKGLVKEKETLEASLKVSSRHQCFIHYPYFLKPILVERSISRRWAGDSYFAISDFPLCQYSTKSLFRCLE